MTEEKNQSSLHKENMGYSYLENFLFTHSYRPPERLFFLFCSTQLFQNKNLLHTPFQHLQEKYTTKCIFKNNAGSRI